jgi:hypothetical protein
MKGIAITILSVLFFQSCQTFVHEERIIDNFYLIAVDSDQEMHVSYKVSSEGDFIGIIPAVVYSVGYDSKYVYAKQHPETSNGKTNFYIVPISVSNVYRLQQEVMGPFNKHQFDKKLNELGVSNQGNLFSITLNDM